MSTREVILCEPVRTAIGAFNGSLKGVPATALGATVVRETLRRSKLDADSIGSVVMGNVIQAGYKMNPARQASIGGGVPVSVPAMTVNRVCGSGRSADHARFRCAQLGWILLGTPGWAPVSRGSRGAVA
jgi:acetyl-CoA C-acetyltransferase